MKSASRRRSVAIALALVLTGLGSGSAGANPRAVIELFTSQGCSSCPPADKLLGELASDESLIALTMPVTIWDYLGWKDTLASEAMSQRQIDYARARGDRRVYTPQVVVCGTDAVVGSDHRAIVRAAREQGPLPLPVEMARVNDLLKVDIGAAREIGADEATVWLMYVDPKVTVPIGRGENSGRTITYTNVVRDMQPIGTWKGKPMSIELSVDSTDREVDASAVALVQVATYKGPGRILGAAKLDDVFRARQAQLKSSR